MKREARLIIDSSERSADLFWATGFFVPDPVVFLKTASRSTLLVSALEFSRAKKHARVRDVLSLELYYKKGLEHRKRPKIKASHHTIALHALLREQKVTHLLVPNSFPYQEGTTLQKLGYTVRVLDPLFPARRFKSAAEVQEIAASMRATERALAKAHRMLKKASVNSRNFLVLSGKILTSERVKQEIEASLYNDGYIALETIVAGGRQSFEPHNAGSGPLRAGEPINIYILPKSKTTGYFGDLTRTFCKGKAPLRLKKMYEAVLAAQQKALRALRAGVPTRQPYRVAAEELEYREFLTTSSQGMPQGFIHGLGHGLGLEVHEEPRLSRDSLGFLAAGHVVTVEPGLYYPDLGGVRIEDTVVITKKGYRNLTSYPKKTLEVRS